MRFKNVTKKPSNIQYQCWYFLRGLYKVLTGNYNFDVYIDKKGVTIGKDVAIGPGVKIITSKHNTENIWTYDAREPVSIGDQCWIGANAVILPGVTLGPHTVVGAGAIVTKSFPKGYCVIVGNPAKKIKDIYHKIISDKLCDTVKNAGVTFNELANALYIHYSHGGNPVKKIKDTNNKLYFGGCDWCIPIKVTKITVTTDYEEPYQLCNTHLRTWKAYR